MSLSKISLLLILKTQPNILKQVTFSNSITGLRNKIIILTLIAYMANG